MVAQLQPTRAELARIFVADVVDAAEAGYRTLWNNRPYWPIEAASERASAPSVVCCHATDFANDGGASGQLPGGYRQIAVHLQPEPIWCVFRLEDAERPSTIHFDGLVLVSGVWRWCPRPWRVLPEPTPELSRMWTE